MKETESRHASGVAATNWQAAYGYRSGMAGAGYYYGGYDGQNYARRTWYDPAGLEQMVAAMRGYDGIRGKLAREGGNVSEIRGLTSMLTHPFSVRGPYGDAEAKLSDPKSVKKALSQTGQYDVYLEIRRGEYGLPVYYLARTHHDCWGTYGLEVEDLYRSGDFPLEDPRFVKFMEAGRGKHYLRLAPFREKIALMPDMQHADNVDNFLYTLGRCVFQGAWHVDQRFSFMVADAFDTPILKEAIELIYMCLNIDLCALRRQLTENMLRFFAEIYPNETLVQLMKMLPSLNDDQFAAISRGASASYVAVTDLFNRFLRTELRWRSLETGRMPLWKLILANMKRLDMVAAQTIQQDEVKEARDTLQTGARECIQCLLSV